MKQYNFSKGRAGEGIAQQHLINLGFTILEKNWRSRFGELDIIATKKGTLHFVEVKLKTGDQFGTPEEMISKRKIWQVRKTAEAYILQKKGISVTFPRYQIDAVCIVLTTDGIVNRVDFYQNLTEY